MAAATQLAMTATSFLCPTAIASKKVRPSNTQSFVTPTTLVVCQQDNKERKTADVSRRIFAAVATSVAALGVFVQPEAQAKRNKPAEEKKKEETEDKSLSAYDARVLANAKRKEAMKAKIDAAKATANPVASSEK